ncbi:MAG: hypothetical protein LBC62_05795 [Treponema sp.]|jgi:hypothetical protein|nr:hypothetical protein [Treponema sp.]
MNEARLFFFIGILFALCLAVPGLGALGKRDLKGSKEAAAPAEQGVLRVTGRVRLVGSMPFPRLVVSDSEDRDWYVEASGQKLIEQYQQQIITIEGIVVYEDIVLANGEKAGVRSFLRNIRLIAKHE